MAWKYNTGGPVQDQAQNPWGFGEQVAAAAEKGKDKVMDVVKMAAMGAKKGGRIYGPSHDNGGVNIKVKNGMLNQLEAEGGEFIASKGAMKFAGPLIEWANYVGNELYPETDASTRGEKNFLEEPLMQVGGPVQAQGSNPWGFGQQIQSAAAKAKKKNEPSVATEEPSDIAGGGEDAPDLNQPIETPVQELNPNIVNQPADDSPQDLQSVQNQINSLMEGQEEGYWSDELGSLSKQRNELSGEFNYGGEIPKYGTGDSVVAQQSSSNPWSFGSSIQNALMMKELRDDDGPDWLKGPKEEEEKGWFSKIKGALGDYKSKRANTKRLEKEFREESFQAGLQDQQSMITQEKIDRERGFSDTPGKTVNRKYQLDTAYDEETDSVTPVYGTRKELDAQAQGMLQKEGEARLDKVERDRHRKEAAESGVHEQISKSKDWIKGYLQDRKDMGAGFDKKSEIADEANKATLAKLMAEKQGTTRNLETSLKNVEGKTGSGEKYSRASLMSLLDTGDMGEKVDAFKKKQEEGLKKYDADFKLRENVRGKFAERRKYDSKTGQSAWDVEAKKQGLSWFDDREAWQAGKDKFQSNIPTESGYRQLQAEEVVPMPVTGEDYYIDPVRQKNKAVGQQNPYEAQINEALEQNRINEERPSLDEMIQMSEEKRNVSLRDKYDVNMMEDNRQHYPKKPGILKRLRHKFGKYQEGGQIQQGGDAQQFTFPSNTGNNTGMINANVLSNMSNKSRMNNIRQYVAEINQQSPMFIDTILSR
jgi:hypothetical protein